MYTLYVCTYEMYEPMIICTGTYLNTYITFIKDEKSFIQRRKCFTVIEQRIQRKELMLKYMLQDNFKLS